MRPDTKIAVVVHTDLATWQKLNVACFLAGGVVGGHPELVGENYHDATGRMYGPLIRQPVLVFAADSAGLTRALGRANNRNLQVSLYTRDLFETDNDADNRAVVASVATQNLDLVGLAVYAGAKEVDKVTRGLALHP